MAGEDRIVEAMAFLRAVGAGVEILAALLMLKFNRVSSALRINAVLGLFGPVILVTVSALGLAGLVGRVSWVKAFVILCGTMLIIAGTR
ncbi:MAG: YqhV family protein [Bacillota bacterium]